MKRSVLAVGVLLAVAAILLLVAQAALADGPSTTKANPRLHKPWAYGKAPYYQKPPTQYYPVVPSYPYGYGAYYPSYGGYYPPPYNGYVYPPQIYIWTPFGFQRYGY